MGKIDMQVLQMNLTPGIVGAGIVLELEPLWARIEGPLDVNK